jgi:intracellular septation protein A
MRWIKIDLDSWINFKIFGKIEFNINENICND